MGASLDCMPPEVLLGICNCLYDDDYAGSLVAFALVSKRNYSVAKYPLARTIKFKLRPESEHETTSGKNPLHKLVKKHHAKLRRNGTFASVRRLVIDRIPPPNGLYGRKEESMSEREQSLMSSLEMHGEDDSRPESYIAHPKDDVFDIEWMSGHQHERDQRYWASLAAFVNRLPGLTDLLFCVRRPFPRCMLRALHETAPRCRLHLRYFRMHSVFDERLDPYDIELASSPCLYSIQCSYPGRGSHQDSFDSEEEGDEPQIKKNNIHNAAVMGLVTQLAPALKQVGLEFPETRHKQPIPLQRFKDLKLPGDIVRISQGSVQSLHLSGVHSVVGINEGPLEAWSACTDFAVLQRLHIDQKLQHEAVGFLGTCHLPSLKALSISIADPCESEDGDEYIGCLAAFLRKVSSRLVSLRIQNWAPSITLSAALGRHLRCLHIKTSRRTTAMSYPLGADSVNEIFELSPFLEELSISIRRTKGDAAEVAVYKALGRFPRLRRLLLELVVLEPPVESRAEGGGAEESGQSNGTHDEDDMFLPFTKGQLKDLLVSVAVDKDLAVAIFNLISSAGGADRLPTLDFLEIQVAGWHGRFQMVRGQMWQAIHPYCLVLGQPYIVRRDPRREHRLKLRVLEAADRWTKCGLRSRAYAEAGNDGALETVFREIWPGRPDPGSVSWTQDWHSFPLQVEG